MEFVRADCQHLPKNMSSCILTLGNFDGIHLGHQQLLDTVKSEAKRLGLPSVVMSFSPYPKEFFLGDRVARLMEWRDKYTVLAEQGIDYFVQWRFDATFANLSAEQFIQAILVESLHAKVVIVGDDFRFGAKRQGDDVMLKAVAAQCGFQVIQMSTLLHDGERISSTRIRHTLQAGNMALAKALLGRYYSICGTVCHGEKLGRQLGFPTANIAVHRRRPPLQGVFVVCVKGLDGQAYTGVANLGTRPAVNGDRVLLEVFLFDFDREIYGEHITVEFVHKLRDEAHYDDLPALKAQIEKDVADAKQFLAMNVW